jgi:hypothetical protein
MTSMMSEHDAYRTSDLALAAALALSYPLEAVDRHTPHGVQWVFRRDACLDELVAQYWRGELQVEPQAYAQQLRRLEAHVHDHHNDDTSIPD